jgi:hypothetical protein
VPQLLVEMLLTHWKVGPVAGQRWKPSWQTMAHWLLAQTAMALTIDGIGQVLHIAGVPHCVRLSFGKQDVPVPGQVCEPAPQSVPQTPAALQVAVAPPGQGVHDTLSTVPQVATAELATHAPLQRWKPALHWKPQTPAALQVRTALACAGHGVQLVPHESGLLLDRHKLGFVAGQAWNPVLQLTPQVGVAPVVAAVQVGLPLAGSVHAMQDVPHELTLVLLSATQVVPQRWNPVLQAGTHAPAALHVTVPLAGAVQTVQLFPQDMIDVLPFTTQVADAPVPHW